MSTPKTPNEPGEWKLIGEVGVDSGQLLITDPYYINSQWKSEDASPLKAPLFTHKDGRMFYCQLQGDRPHPDAQPFKRFDEVLEPYDKTVDELGDSGELTSHRSDPDGEYSYVGCCNATLTDEQAGQLNYALGHAGAGVVFSSGLGDGCYEVWARYVDAGEWGTRVAEVRVIMIDDKELDDET